MDVSIVIRAKNEAESIEETLKRVEEQEFSGKCEIVVVDSGSTDSTLDLIKRHGVRLLQIPEKEFTYGSSLNIGASHAKGKFVVNLSAHALPLDRNWLRNLITGFEDDNVAAVYGRQLSVGHLNPFEALQNETFFGSKELTFNSGSNRMLKHLHFSNGNSAVRKDVWQRIKFNEEVPYAEDALWQRGVLEAGFSIVYVPDAAVYHTHRVSIRNTYGHSRDCAYTLSVMQQKTRSVPMLLYDVGLLLALVPISIFKNVTYIWRNKYLEHMGTTPFFVLSGWFGWLVGRTRYRLQRR
jgi:rhamnosyltransferase